jgi:DNA-binding response OmpR family regulator
LSGAKPLEGRRIFIVEDDREIRRMLTIVLEAAGAQVATAASANAALESLATCTPDVLVVDWNLPDMSGGDLIAAIRTAGHAPRSPALIVTGGLMPDEARRVGETIGTHLLQKPFRPAALVGAITELLSAT